MTARVSPTHRDGPPYKFTISGKIVPPRQICPPGTTNRVYCALPPAEACSGSVTITVTLGDDPLLASEVGQTLASGQANVTRGCTYESTLTIPTSALTVNHSVRNGTPGQRAPLVFNARFLGNSVLSPMSARPVVVHAKIVSTT